MDCKWCIIKRIDVVSNLGKGTTGGAFRFVLLAPRSVMIWSPTSQLAPPASGPITSISISHKLLKTISKTIFT